MGDSETTAAPEQYPDLRFATVRREALPTLLPRANGLPRPSALPAVLYAPPRYGRAVRSVPPEAFPGPRTAGRAFPTVAGVVPDVPGNWPLHCENALPPRVDRPSPAQPRR